jgi:hypothetical protein
MPIKSSRFKKEENTMAGRTLPPSKLAVVSTSGGSEDEGEERWEEEVQFLGDDSEFPRAANTPDPAAQTHGQVHLTAEQIQAQQEFLASPSGQTRERPGSRLVLSSALTDVSVG